MTGSKVTVVACLVLLAQTLLLFLVAGPALADRGNPDLTLSSDDIVFSQDKPLKGDTVQMNATVHNVGSSNASSVRVRFYDGQPSGGVTIGSDQILESVPFGESAVARVNWSTGSVSSGTHYIFVVVDPVGSITEESEQNNSANKSIYVNLAPSAKVDASSLGDHTWIELDFSAENSSDPDGDIITCFWDFDDGNTTKGIQVSHAWADDGAYTVTLLVTDDCGGTDSDEVKVTILNRKPTAVAYDQTLNTLETVTFDSANSTDDDGYIQSAKWTLHNGTVLSGKKVTTVYPQDGSYQVKLTATDDDDETNTTNFWVTVLNRDPIPKINVSDSHINASESVTFDAYNSYDLDGYITNYTWLFPGGVKKYGAKITHLFGIDNGSVKVTLAVVDDDGAVASAQTVIRVGNLPPVSVGGLDTLLYTYENVTFDATKSYDPDGSIVNYTWNFGDGTTSNNALDVHYWKENGTYNVTLLVTDNDGATALSSLMATVLNQPPMAFFPDILVLTYQNVSLNGSYCYDNDGILTNFTWNLGGGTFLYGPEATYTWTRKGTFEVTLTVRDDDGTTASCTFNVSVDNQQPRASFSLEPKTPTELQDVTFNASASTDMDGIITSYNWNFGDGSYGSGRLVQHAYLANGTFKVVLIVTDNDGGTSTAFQNITVAKYNAPPVAVFSFTPSNPTTTDFIQFDASASYDPAPGHVKRYEWEWGDGNRSQLSLARTTHRFTAVGTFTVTLTAVDDMDAKGNFSQTLVVELGVNRPPVAVIYASQLVQESGQPMTLDGSSSHDTDGMIVNHTWDFGDGSLAFYPLVSHVFSHSQNFSKEYTVTLTVMDNQGGVGSSSVVVTITPRIPPNLKPRAILTVAPASTSVYTNQVVTLSAAGSSDPDGTIPEDGYTWSLGDGELKSGMVVFHRYLKPGIYVVLLTVKDDRGATGSATETIYVLNVPPTARPGDDIQTITLQETPFSGVTSTDLDGEIVYYYWDFGDGTTGTGSLAGHVYYHAGVYAVRLTVTDDTGSSASATLNVTVLNRAPVAKLVGSNATGFVNDPLIFDGSQSNDTDGRLVNYTWDFGDGSKAEGSLLKHSFTREGTYQVLLTVMDDSGAFSNTSMTVKVDKRPVIVPPKADKGKGFIPGFEFAPVLAALALLSVVASRRRGRSRA